MPANPLVRLFQIALTLTALVAPSFAGIPDDRGLADLVVATAFQSFGRSTEGTVVARFEKPGEREPARVWVHEKGALREGSRKDLDRAFGKDRKKWPAYTLLYTVSPGAAGGYELELSIYYDMGITPESRGGYSEVWRVAHQEGRWVVLAKETTLHWD
jgi:hypothetical protein